MDPAAEEVIRIIQEIGYKTPLHQLRADKTALRLITLCQDLARRAGTTPEDAYQLCRHLAMQRDRKQGPSSIPPRA